MMPGMSGWEVCRKIREDVALAHTGVIMLTGIGENLNEMTSPALRRRRVHRQAVRVRRARRQSSRRADQASRVATRTRANRTGRRRRQRKREPTLLSSDDGGSSEPPRRRGRRLVGRGPSEVTNGHDETIILVQTGMGPKAKAGASKAKKKAAKPARERPKPGRQGQAQEGCRQGEAQEGAAEPAKKATKAKAKPKPKKGGCQAAPRRRLRRKSQRRAAQNPARGRSASSEPHRSLNREASLSNGLDACPMICMRSGFGVIGTPG